MRISSEGKIKMKSKETSAKSTAQIFRDNICTVFNLLPIHIGHQKAVYANSYRN